MKTTFRNVMDNLELDEELNFSNLPDLDETAIRQNVFSQLGRKNGRKSLNKKFIISLIAAVVGIAVTSTAVFAGLGGVSAVFGDYFSSYGTDAILYTGNNVEITAADDLNVQFLGITGDEEELFACIEISRKDGKPLTEEGYDTADRHSGRFQYGDSISTYSINEDRTKAKLYFNYDHTGHDISNDTIEIVESGIYAYKKKTLLIANCDPSEKKIGDYQQQAEKIKQEMGLGQDAEHQFFYNGTGYDCYLVEGKFFPLYFSVKFDLNGFRPSNTININLDNAPYFISGDAQNKVMKVSPFKIKCYADYEAEGDTDKVLSLDFKNIDPEKSQILMDDGTRYYLIGFAGAGGTRWGYHENIYRTENSHASYIIKYCTYPDHAYGVLDEVNIIDTRKIAKIIINGEVIYSK